tara:strand:- start:479 stop:868 length:390 start_codon:yes stop_codon:yes gene_type:complete
MIYFKETNHQILRFIISGCIATTINFLVYNLIFLSVKSILIASVFGYTTGLLTSFIFAKIWVFKDKSKERVMRSFFVFCLIYILGGIEMSFIIVVLNQLINNHRLAWLVGVLIGSLNNYLGSKYLLFRK